MDDLISREGYKKVIDEQLRFYNPDSSPWHVKILELQRELLDSMPAVDAVPVVHARWQGVSPFVDTEECSNCRYNIQSEELETPYCPWCGAKMDGEQRLAFANQNGAEYADNPTV